MIDAASGLTTIEAENAFALSVVESKAIDPVIVAKEKAQAVKKNGLLELIETKENLDSIGGLDVLKEWLLKRRHAFASVFPLILAMIKGPTTQKCKGELPLNQRNLLQPAFPGHLNKARRSTLFPGA